ncbi:MAG: PorP/SprF family type IX secretion system membrane protein [Bacteroidales bacterium]|nr:PorP/SprF family type IX secretion system membrane protein [Bacteroidales bacterium]
MKKINNIFFLLFVLIIGLLLPSTNKVLAQQEPHFTQYMFNRLSYNPAYAGSNGAICFTGFYRNQWMGLDITDARGNNLGASSGETMNLSFDMPVRFLHGGVGATVISDKIGFWNNMYIKLDYAFRIQFPTGNLAIGIEGQLFNHSLDASNLVGSGQFDERDQILDPTDPIILAGDRDDMLFDVAAGIYYQIPGKLYIGAAASKLLETRSDKLSWDNRRCYYVLAGYEWVLPDYPSLRVLPSALLKTDFAASNSYQVDASLLIEYEHKVWGGLSYRIQDAVMLMAGFAWHDFKAGLSYDIPTSRLSTQASGSLELFLRYCFKIESQPDPPTIYRNTIKM